MGGLPKVSPAIAKDALNQEKKPTHLLCDSRVAVP